MTVWRDVASQQIQAELDGLLNITLPFAQQMLAKRGEFYPFGAAVTAGGETRLLAGDIGQEHPGSADVLAFLIEQFVIGPDRPAGGCHLLRCAGLGLGCHQGRT